MTKIPSAEDDSAAVRSTFAAEPARTDAPASLRAPRADESAAATAPRHPAASPSTPPSTPRSRRWRVPALCAAAVLLAASALAWWFLARPAPAHYVTVPITRGDVVHTVNATGTVNPVLTIIVGSYVSGVIQQQYCDFNTRVHKGQLCAKIDPRPYQTQVDQAHADLDNARAQITKDRALLAYAKGAFERDTTLLQRGIVSQDTADNARSAYDQARAQVAVDSAVIEQRSAALRAAQVSLGYTNIVSPVDGTVVSRNVTIGQTVAASFQTPTLFLIAADLTQMQVDTNVSESDIGGLREHADASFTVEAFPKRQFSGRVVQVRQAPQTVQNVVTYDVVIGVDNADLSLKPGMTATARIVVETRENVLRAPDQALRFNPTDAPPQAAPGAGHARLWVLRKGHPTAVMVTLGLDDDAYSEIKSGDLRQGDAVIVGEAPANAAPAAVTAPRLHT